MTTAYASLNLLTLVVSWLGEAAITYTLQTSTDLLNWRSLPFVMTGSGEWESFTVEKEGPKSFARLRYSADGDTNENGLPDLWEWEQFGYLDVDPSGDADRDGRSNFTEWLDATDPLDFYDGQTPVIRLACGSSWQVPAGQPSSQLLDATVFHPSGEPWINAPLKISMESGDPGLLPDGQEHETAVAALTRWTDDNGKLHPDSQPVRVVGPGEPGAVDRVLLSAGRAHANLEIRATGTDLGPPPRQLAGILMSTGEVRYSWSGPPGAASHFLIQERQPDGTWADIASIPASDLPSPDPVTGFYSLLIGSNAG